MDFHVAMLSNPSYPSYDQFVLDLQGHEQMIMTKNGENKESINHEQSYLTQQEEKEIEKEDFFLEVVVSLQ